MKCFSDVFIKRLKEILNSEKLVLAVFALKGGSPIAEKKKRYDVQLIKMTRNNRGSLLSEIIKSGILHNT